MRAFHAPSGSYIELPVAFLRNCLEQFAWNVTGDGITENPDEPEKPLDTHA
jgi:hypothetical protein